MNCKNGHPLNKENLRLYTTKTGATQRVCRVCQRNYARRKKGADLDAPTMSREEQIQLFAARGAETRMLPGHNRRNIFRQKQIARPAPSSQLWGEYLNQPGYKRAEHCRQGHPLTENTTYLYRREGRLRAVCRTCCEFRHRKSRSRATGAAHVDVFALLNTFRQEDEASLNPKERERRRIAEALRAHARRKSETVRVVETGERNQHNAFARDDQAR